MRLSLRIASLLFVAYLTIGHADRSAWAAETPDPYPSPGYVVVVDIDQKSNKIAYRRLAPGKVVIVDVSDMKIDTECMENVIWSDGQPLRLSLLERGCAYLLPGKGTQEEQAADPGPPTDDQEGSAWSWPSVWASIKTWSRENWQFIVGTTIGVGGLAWVLWFIYHRRVRVLLLGAPGAGKTDLWTALKDGAAPDSNATPTIGRSQPHELEPINWGSKHTLYPEAIDSSGTEPWHVRDQLQRSRYTLRWRRKMVLIIVLAPTPKNSGQAGVDPVESSYIHQQHGYMSLPRAIIGTKYRRQRPHLVIVFVTKLDLLETLASNHNSGAGQRLRAVFAPHRDLVEGLCREKGVPFHFAVGSSQQGWGVEDIRKQFTKVLTR